jgi:hypothetical protein
MANERADGLLEIPSLCERICRNWKLSSASDFFVSPVKSPSPEAFQDWKFVKTLALFSEKMKGKQLVEARASMHSTMRALDKVGEVPIANDLYHAMNRAVREFNGSKERANEYRRMEKASRRDCGLVQERMDAAQAKGNSGMTSATGADTNKKLPEVRGQTAKQRQYRSELQSEHQDRPASTDQRTYKQPDRRNEFLDSNEHRSLPVESRWQEAKPRHRTSERIEKNDDEPEDLPDDPKGASFDELQALHAEKDNLYEAQEDYYHAMRLQILARYRRLIRYSRDVQFIESRASNARNDVQVPRKGKSWSDRKKSTILGHGSQRRASGRGGRPYEVVDEADKLDQSDIEDRISFYNFGYTPENEEGLTREEEMQLLPYDIDIAKLHSKRYELRDRWPSGCKDYDTSLIAYGRALYAARRLKLWNMRRDDAGASASVDAEDQELH